VNLPYAEICAHRIDNHEHDVADALDRLAQEAQVGDEAKHLVFTAHARAVDEVDVTGVGTSRDQPWQDGVACAVFSVEPEDIALRRASFAARQFDCGRDGSCDEGGDLPFAIIG